MHQFKCTASFLYYNSRNSGGARPKAVYKAADGSDWIVKFRHIYDPSCIWLCLIKNAPELPLKATPERSVCCLTVCYYLSVIQNLAQMVHTDVFPEIGLEIFVSVLPHLHEVSR